MTPAQHCLAEGHEIGNGVNAISDELFSVLAMAATPVRLMYFLQIVGYQRLRLIIRLFSPPLWRAVIWAYGCLCMV